MLAWQELEVLVDEAERVLLTTHTRPDGDGLGSELALADLLVQKGKEVEIFNPSPTPRRYHFLDPDGSRIGFPKDSVGAPSMAPDLLIIVDTGTWSQLGRLADYVRQTSARKVVIDHHGSQDDLGALQLVDSASAASGMLIYQAFERLEGQLTADSAHALFVAVAMDTGWLRHPNATPEVFAVAGELVALGARPSEAFHHLFEANTVSRLRLLGVMLDRLTQSRAGRLAYSFLLQQDIRDTDSHPMDTEDFINYLMSVQGVETAALFIEQKGGGTKVSFRSRGGLDCRRLAEQFGGGGHQAAAGATLDIPIDEARKRVLGATELAMG